MERYVIDYSLKNGLGKPSISIYLTGCDKPTKCKGCHNWELQNKSKDSCDIEDIKVKMDKIISEFLEFHAQLNVSILGGDPLAEYNRNIALEISKHIKAKHEKSTISIYSWRTIDSIKKEGLLGYIQACDYGVLGDYDESLYVENMIPSSTNQYIYDIKNEIKLQPIKLQK